jgi:hypothetical protein
MNKRLAVSVTTLVLPFVLATFLHDFSNVAMAEAPTKIHPSPDSTVASCGANFAIDIDIEMASDITGYQVYLSWDQTLMNLTDIAQGPFLSNNSMYETFFTCNNDSAEGILRVWEAQLAGNTLTAVEGNGTLFTITFLGTNVGQCSLDLHDTMLVLLTTPVSHSTRNGQVEIAGPDDVAVTTIVPYKNIVGQEYCMKTNVTVQNQGTNIETFSLTLAANLSEIETRNVIDLTSGTLLTLVFSWNTTSFVEGNYTLTAYAWPVPNETHTSDNTLTCNTVRVTIPGDFNGDFKVGPADFALLSAAYGSTPDKPRWNANCDVDDDDKVGPYDFAILSTDFGQHYP